MRVHRAGAPSLDHLHHSQLLRKEELENNLRISLSQPTLLVAYHPVTIFRETTREANALFDALQGVSGQIIFCYPNADAGSRMLIERATAFLHHRGNGHIFTNLDAVTYWSLLQHVDLLLGNSSSGIMETASFALPTINIGMRQQGRERAQNVIDAPADSAAILNAIQTSLSESFRQSLAGMTNPYGDGHASETIVKVLTSVELSESLLIKHARALKPDGTWAE